MKISFDGLGQMGKPITKNLAKAGAEVIATDRKPDAFPDLEATGVQTTTDFARLAEGEIVFLCLPNGQVVHDVLLGESGLAKRLRPDQLVVDLSTITYSTSVAIAKALGEKGVAFLDAPISGMEARAVDGTLTVMCGGDRAAFDRAKPLLESIGSTILFMGQAGSGQLTKLINQLLLDINAAALAEVLPMAAKMGLDPDRVAAVVNSGTGRSYASEFFLPRILRGHFGDGYPMGHA